MDNKEDKKDEKGKEVGTPEDTGKGVQSETDEKVAKLNADTERINQAIAENENAKARQKLGGEIPGQTPEDKPKEQTPVEYMDEVMSGSKND